MNGESYMFDSLLWKTSLPLHLLIFSGTNNKCSFSYHLKCPTEHPDGCRLTRSSSTQLYLPLALWQGKNQLPDVEHKHRQRSFQTCHWSSLTTREGRNRTANTYDRRLNRFKTLFLRLFVDHIIRTPCWRFCSSRPLPHQGSPLLSRSWGTNTYSYKRMRAVMMQWHLPAVKMLAWEARPANSPQAVQLHHGVLAQLETESD